jgi:hypothetical protein
MRDLWQTTNINYVAKWGLAKYPKKMKSISNVKIQSDEKSSNISNVGTKNRVPVLGVLKSNNLS